MRNRSNSLFIFCLLMLAEFSSCLQNHLSDSNTMMLKKSVFGKMLDGTRIYQYSLNNEQGMQVKIINYGGIITNIIVPDKNNRFEDVVLGFDSLSSYLDLNPYFGAITGRYANRICLGKFTLDGESYQLTRNSGIHHLHGGAFGFDKQLWSVEELRTDTAVGIKLTYLSKDGEEKYPGNLSVSVVYTLNNKNELAINYEAQTDKPTPLNLTNHSSFNLSGGSSKDILGHIVMIPAHRYTVIDEQGIPTGEIQQVAGTALDFSSPATVAKRINKTPNGYDYNYVFDKKAGVYELAAVVTEPKSKRKLEIYSTEPGLQLYTGNFLDGSLTGKGGIHYQKHAGLCLEAQHYPDSPNHPEFPNTILRPGEKYTQHTVYKFTVDN